MRLRQGEALGLRWSNVDLDRGLLWVRKSPVRPIYRHGSDGRCGTSSGWCPERVLVNGEDGETKSRAGRRVVGLPGPLVGMLVEHREQQAKDRERARQLWRESGRVFTSVTGSR